MKHTYIPVRPAVSSTTKVTVDRRFQIQRTGFRLPIEDRLDCGIRSGAGAQNDVLVVVLHLWGMDGWMTG